MNSVALAGLLLVTSCGRLIAQAQPFSIGDIEDLLGSAVSEVRILQLVRRDCLLFKLDAKSEQRLRDTAGASAAFIRGLRTVCFAGAALEVTSEPAGLEVWLGDRRVGTTPWSAEVARGMLTVGVRRGEWRDSVTARLPVDRMVRVRFRTPRDTLAWPIEPERERLAAALDRSLEWTPSRPEPVGPEPFAGKPPKGRRIVGAVVGAVAGGAAGYAIDPHSDSLVADVAAGSAVFGIVGWWVGKKLDDAAYNRRVRDYQRRETEHDAGVAAWHEQMDAERAVVLDRLVDSAVAAERARTDSLRALIRVENERIRARNRAAPGPSVTVERLP